MKLQDLQDLHVEQLSCWCDLWIDGVAFMFHVPLVESVRKCKHLCAHKFRFCFARCRIEGTCFSFGLFSCSDMFRPRKRHSISEPSGVSFQPFCLLQVSGVIMLLLGTSWFKPRKIEIKPRSPCAVDKLASLLAHLTGANSQGCHFPCWNCSGPLSFGLVHWFCPSNTNLPLLHGCASGSNSSGWKRACLGLHMLKV